MIAKYLIIATWVFHVLNAAVVRTDTCEDLEDKAVCDSLASYCESVPTIRAICAGTCKVCQEIRDPCEIDNGGCNHYCSGTLLAECSCRNGFQLGGDRKTCIDFDECSVNPCEEGTECVNTVGSFSCQLLNCEQTLGPAFLNYYKSDTCCIAEPSEKTMPRTIDFKEEGLDFFLADSTVQWPWQAQMLYNNEHRCGATLVSERWIITSALCVNSAVIDQITIVLGNVLSAHYDVEASTSRVERKINQIVIHPDSESNDVALLELDEPVIFSNLIQPVKFPCGETPLVGSTCYVTGFGTTDDHLTSTRSRSIKEIPLPIVSSEYCSLVYENTVHEFNATTQICAGHLQGGEDACNGDSGSPLVCQRYGSCSWYLSGIVSSGNGCGERGFPGIYVNVNEYENFVRETIGSDVMDMCSN